MNPKSLLLSWLGALLFFGGVLIGLVLSGAIAWSESEARIYSSFNGERSLSLRCPLIISPVESGTVSTEINNLIHEDIKPMVTAQISHGRVPREISQTVSLAPGNSETVQWTVDSSDVIFERVILVNVLQSRYSDNPTHSGACGIFVFSLLGLTGMQTFALIFAVSLIFMFSGGWLWLYAHRPLDKFSGNIVQINSVLLGVTVLALLSTLAHWWGVVVILDLLSLLVMGVILTEFVMFSQKHRE